MGRASQVIAIWAFSHLIMLAIVVPAIAGDGLYYVATAQHFAQTWQIADMVRPPLYPVFLAPFASDPLLIFAAQSLLSAALALGVLRLSGSRLAALLVAGCPFLVAFDYLALAECLLIFLLTIGWLLLERDRPIIGGICIGLAILTRDTVLLLPLLSLPIGWFLGRKRAFLTMALAAYAVVVPWMGHNWVQFGHASVSEGRMGYNLWVGTWETDSNWSLAGYDPVHAQYPADAFRSPAERQRMNDAWQNHDDATYRAVAIDRMVSEPVQVATTWAKRYWRMWLGTRMDLIALRAERGSMAFTALKGFFWFANLLLLAAGFYALIVRRQWFLAIPIVYTALIYVPFHNLETRFTLPIAPLLIIAVARWLGDRPQPRLTARHN